MKIIHIGTMPTLNQMGDITRNIHNLCEGEHVYYSLPDWYNLREKPKGIYILHHFKNPKYLKMFDNFRSPKGSSIVSLLHSSPPCRPHPRAARVVTISEAQQKNRNNDFTYSTLIRGAIDTEPYLAVTPKYSIPVFGRISRWEPGKFHPYWNNFINIMLKKYDEAQYVMITNNPPEKFIINHERATYIQGIQIDDIESKAKYINCMNIYADAHGDFLDTFNVCLLESMACGLAPLILRGNQEPMAELIGDAGIIAENETDFLDGLHRLIQSEDLRREYGEKARARAREYKLTEMIEKWNLLLKKLA